MIPVPVSDEEANLLHASYEDVKIYVDGLRPVNGADFFDANGDIALPLSHARWADNSPNDGASHETGLMFFMNRVGDTWADVVYIGNRKRCLCI